jgi:DnaK suppressor protein
MEHLSEEQRDVLREQLEDHRKSVRSERHEELKSVGQPQAADVGDTQDAASGEESRQRSAAMLAKYDRILAEIDDALARMARGTFGVCEETDEPIPFGRLRVHPTTRYSVAAQELREHGRSDEDGGGDAY